MELQDFLTHKKTCVTKRIMATLEDWKRDSFFEPCDKSWPRDRWGDMDEVDSLVQPLSTTEFLYSDSPTRCNSYQKMINRSSDRSSSFLKNNLPHFLDSMQQMPSSDSFLNVLKNVQTTQPEKIPYSTKGNSEQLEALQSVLNNLQQQQFLQLQVIRELQFKICGKQMPRETSPERNLTAIQQSKEPVISVPHNESQPQNHHLDVCFEPYSAAVSHQRHDFAVSKEPNTLELLQRHTEETLQNNMSGGHFFYKGMVIENDIKRLDSGNEASVSEEEGKVSQKSMLSRHQCRYCRKIFGSDSGLQIHIRSHTGERPFKCNICGNRFSTKGNLKVHFQRHKFKYPYIKMNPNPVPEHLDKAFPSLEPQISLAESMQRSVLQEMGNIQTFPFFQQRVITTLPPPVNQSHLMEEDDLKGIFTKSVDPSPVDSKADVKMKPANDGSNLNIATDSSDNSFTVVTGALDSFSPENHPEGEVEHMDAEVAKKGENQSYFFSEESSVSPPATPSGTRSSILIKNAQVEPKFSDLTNFPVQARNESEKLSEITQLDNELSSHQGILSTFRTTDKFSENLPVKSTFPDISNPEGSVDKIETGVAVYDNECSICHKVFSDKSALKMHYSIHSNEQFFQCKLCGSTYTAEETLRTHMMVHTIRPDERMSVKCRNNDSCPEELKNVTSLVFSFKDNILSSGVLEASGSPHSSPRISDNSTSPNSNSGSIEPLSVENNDVDFERRCLEDRDDITDVSVSKTLHLNSEPSTFETKEVVVSQESIKFHTTSLAALENHVKTINWKKYRRSPTDVISLSRHNTFFPGFQTKDVLTLQNEQSTLFSTSFESKLTKKENLESSKKETLCGSLLGVPEPLPKVSQHVDALSTSPDSTKLTSPPLVTGSEREALDLTPRSQGLPPVITPSSSESTFPLPAASFSGFPFPPSPGFHRTTCGVCFKTFACSSALTIHIRSHTKERPFRCNLCNRGFTTKGNMKQHMLTHKVSDISTQNHSASFSSSSTTTTRLPTVSNSPLTSMNRSTKDLSNDDKNKSRHENDQHQSVSKRSTGVSKHECLICNRPFSSGSALNIHMRTHTGDRPFKCNFCGRAFTTKGNLKVHMGTHMWSNSTSRRGPNRVSVESAVLRAPRPALSQLRPNLFFPYLPPIYINELVQRRENEIPVIQNSVTNNTPLNLISTNSQRTLQTHSNTVNNSGVFTHLQTLRPPQDSQATCPPQKLRLDFSSQVLQAEGCPPQKSQLGFSSDNSQTDCSAQNSQLTLPSEDLQTGCPPQKSQLSFSSNKLQAGCSSEQRRTDFAPQKARIFLPPEESQIIYHPEELQEGCRDKESGKKENDHPLKGQMVLSPPGLEREQHTLVE
ncbi:sal-like protein 1 isoform X2 [Tachypleus tridentatus]